MKGNPNWDSETIQPRIGGRIDELDKAKREFDDFVLKSYESMVALMKKKLGTRQLRMEAICRMDVSLIENGVDGLHYFVNEIETGLGASIWSFFDDNPAERIVDEMRACVRDWVIHRKCDLELQ